MLFQYNPHALADLILLGESNMNLTQASGFPTTATTDTSSSVVPGRHTVDMIKVSANSRTSAVAGAIAGVIRDRKRAEVQAIGAGAVNQAMKALILATGYLRSDGIYVSCIPEFADVTIEDKIKTAIKLVIEPSAESDFSSLQLSVNSLRGSMSRGQGTDSARENV
jgi:stage V sporulation protein S